jgi:glycosyltransferase involved in cell wall biosynthesis
VTGSRTAIVAAPNHWTSVLQVGTHHIARALAQSGWDVAYLSDPVSPFHLVSIRRVETRQRIRLYLQGGRREGRVLAYVPGTLMSPRGPRIPGTAPLAESWVRRTLPSLERVLVRHGFAAPDMIWFDSVVFAPLLDLVPGAKSVLRIADRNAGFVRHRLEFDAMERSLATRVDAVIYSAAALEPHVRSLDPKQAIHMPNGVDLDRFRERVPEPVEYAAIPKPRAIYVGAMAEWFDYELVNRLVETLPTVSFVLVGPDEIARGRLRTAPNLYLVGRVAPPRIPAFLQNADVGLIPFDVVGSPDLINSVHPIKLYEYLASGLPVVAAEWPELAALRSPAKLYRTLEEARAHIEAAIVEPRVDSSAWLAGSDWGDRLHPVMSALGISGAAPIRK